MKKILILVSSLLFFFASCDKIEPSEDGTYTSYSGAIGTWEDCPALSDHTQRVWIEKYTGPKCPNCPDADVAINNLAEQPAYQNKLVVTAIHATDAFGSPIFSTSPDLRTPDGESWSNTFFGSAASFPAALLNRQQNGNTLDITQDFSALSGKVDAILSQEASVAIDVNSNYDNQAGKVKITASVELLSEISDDITLTVLLIEDSLVAAQKMPDYTIDTNHVHNHVLRGLITDKWGIDIDIQKSLGSARKVTLFTPLQDNCILNNCHIVAFVSDKSSRTIYNVAACRIEQ